MNNKDNKDNKKIARLLNEDLRHEHAAIIQYLQHAYVLGEGDARSEIEEIAREEMYHFQWLSEAIAGLLEDPSMERAEVILTAPTAPDLMEINVQTEEGAIQLYLEHLSKIENSEIRALIERILVDEREHQEIFRTLQSEVVALSIARGENPPHPGVKSLNEAFQGEYSTFLQYLHQSFKAPSCGFQRRMSDFAIVNMKHMGWLGERIIDQGGVPNPDVGAINTPKDEASMAAVNRQRLAELKETYQRAEATQDPATLHLLNRIERNERYQRDTFETPPERCIALPESETIEKIKKMEKKEKPSWTVGPLKT